MERIRDGFGILINDDQLQKLAFEKSLQEIGPDLIFAGKSGEYELLRRFHYEFGEEVVEEDDDSSEADIRRGILKMSYMRLSQLADEIDLFRKELERKTADHFGSQSTKEAFSESGHRLYYNKFTKIFSFGEQPANGRWVAADSDFFEKRTTENSVPAEGKKLVWEDVLLDGLISASTFDLLQRTVEQKSRELSRLQAYGPDLLYQIKDFRVLAGLRYLISLCREMGIKSPMEAVLSFPLGSNVFSILDVARAYETIATGTRKTRGRVGAGDGLLLIDRIESSDGEIIFRPAQSVHKVIDNKTSLAVTDILRNVMQHGTGRSVHNEVQVVNNIRLNDQSQSEITLPIPLFGKTGTANGFRNSAFAGFVPVPDPGKRAVQVLDGYFVASYVGYDDNRPMVRETTRIAGSSGALPVWSMVAKTIVFRDAYSSSISLEDLAAAGQTEVPVNYQDLGQIRIPSDSTDKIKVDDSWKMSYSRKNRSVKYGNGVVTFGEMDPDGVFLPTRYFKPYWMMAH
jgi:hypothetical protein